MESFDETNGPRSGVFPSLYEYPEDVEAESGREENLDSMMITEKPKIIIMGLRRSGKSSIQKVVFDKMSPNETLFLDSTSRPTSKEDFSDNSIVSFSVWDFLGQMDMFEREADVENTFKNCGALIFVIDSQDDHHEALVNLNSIVRKAHSINPNINFEVFIHKVDGLSDDHKIETRQAIHQRANEDFADMNEEDNAILLSFYLTSIYDHSIFEAFSKVVQKLIPQLPILENILNFFNSVSVVEKSFLFDVASKIFIATDSSPVDMQSYELCCDMIDVVMDIDCIYGSNETNSTEASFDKNTEATIPLSSNTVLYLRQVNKFLALVCIIRSENFTMEGLIDYNFKCIREAIQSVFLNGKDPARAMIHSNNIMQRLQTYNEDRLNGTDSDSLREFPSPPISTSVNNNINKPQQLQQSPQQQQQPQQPQQPQQQQQQSPQQDIVVDESPMSTPKRMVPEKRAQTQRKYAILPTTATVSSLPNHQNYVPFPSSVDEGLTFRAKTRNIHDSN